MNELELERYRKYIDDLIVKKNKGDISEEFYQREFAKYYEVEKQFGLLVPGSPFWDEMLDEYNEKYPPEDEYK